MKNVQLKAILIQPGLGRLQDSLGHPVEKVNGMDKMSIHCRQMAGVITEITGLRFWFFENEDTASAFREEYCFFDGQTEFAPAFLTEISVKLDDRLLFHVQDELGVHFVFFTAGDCLVAAGPFVTGDISKREIRQLIDQNRLKGTDVLDMEVYLTRFPSMEAEEAVRIVRALLHGLDPDAEERRVKEEIYTPRPDLTVREEERGQRINYTLLLEKRYGYERAFRRNVMEGDERSAIMNLRNMFADTAYLSRSGNTLDNNHAGAAIVRTIARIAALDGGLSDIIADRISSKNAAEEMRTHTRAESAKLTETMVRNYCTAIRTLRQERYSALVQSVIYQMEHHYQDDVSLTALAEELAVSKNYLIQRFKAETGTTPVRYLTDLRMRRAAQLLAEQELSVQEIANAVGVPDSNYFTKLFKKAYGVTPKQYRKDRIV